ncbi:MAG: carbonic anhydrase [Microscillaceae bacterium]|nr:carbonic anhydrase [Microscillaceae bacterium]
MLPHEILLLQNKAWVKESLATDSNFFEKLVKEQKPYFLWIGCSDSRVPAETITNTEPGTLFVHRNIANMVVHTDFNMLSVLQYSVDVLKIKHIIVCGHYGCGGVRASMTQDDFGLINKWLRNIKDVYRLHKQELEAIPETEKRLNRLVELNVREQILNLAKTSIVQHAWRDGLELVLHGWVYDMADGLIIPVCKMEGLEGLESIYKFTYPLA